MTAELILLAPATGRASYVLHGQMVGADALELLGDLSSLPWQHMSSLVLSMAGVDAIDTSGVAVLVRLHGNLWVAGIRLVLEDVNPEVLAVLERVRLTDVIDVRGSED